MLRPRHLLAVLEALQVVPAQRVGDRATDALAIQAATSAPVQRSGAPGRRQRRAQLLLLRRERRGARSRSCAAD